MAAEADALKSMVLSFRVSELQMLLGFAGRNKSGRKTELQARAVELLRLRSLPIQMKIKELYKLIQQGAVPGTSGMPTQQSMPSPPHTDIPMAHNNSMQQQQHQMQSQQQRSGVVYNPSGYASQAPSNRPMYNPGPAMYHHYSSKPHQPQTNYPVHPDVKLKKLPFSEVVGELIKPSTLVPHNTQRPQESTFQFHLTPQQATLVASNRDNRGPKPDFLYQVQLRFCLLETSCDQDDCFPPGAGVKANNKIVPLPNPIPTNKPGVEPKRPPRPVNISQYCKLSPTVANYISVTWNPDYGRGYVVAVYLVRKLTSSDLLSHLTKKGVRNADFTRGLIKEKLNEDADCEIATTSLRVSLACPLGKMRMMMPCRASTCQHLQCFDASLYLQMNEKKPTWNCPVCDKAALFDNLVIDGYFQEVLVSGKLPSEGNEVQLHQDGSWTAMYVKKEKTELCLTPAAPSRVAPKIETIEDFDVVPLSTQPEPKKPAAKPDVVDLTLSDSDDDEFLAKKATTTTPVPVAIKPDSSNRLTDSASSTTSSASTAGGSVSSSGYRSPNIITLDSPSPPATPVPQNSILNMQQQSGQSLYFPSFHEIDSDSSSPQPGLHNSLYRF